MTIRGGHPLSTKYQGQGISACKINEWVGRYARIANHSLLELDEARSGGTDREIGKLVPTFIMRLAQGTTKNRLIAND